MNDSGRDVAELVRIHVVRASHLLIGVLAVILVTVLLVEDIDAQIDQLKAEREHIRNKIRRAPKDEKPELKLQAKAVTQKMDPLRKQQRIAKRIAERSAPKVENLLAMERQQETEATRTRTRNGRSYER